MAVSEPDAGLQDVVSKVLVMWRPGVQEDHELPATALASLMYFGHGDIHLFL